MPLSEHKQELQTNLRVSVFNSTSRKSEDPLSVSRDWLVLVFGCGASRGTCVFAVWPTLGEVTSQSRHSARLPTPASASFNLFTGSVPPSSTPSIHRFRPKNRHPPIASEPGSSSIDVYLSSKAAQIASRTHPKHRFPCRF